MKTTYYIKSKESGNTIEYSYINGFLVFFSVIDFTPNTDQNEYMRRYCPWKEEYIQLYKNDKKFMVTQIKEEATFDLFWEKYRKKEGKHAAQKAWTRLSKKDKIIAITNIGEYNKALSRQTWRTKMLASKWLNQREFETEWATIM